MNNPRIDHLRQILKQYNVDAFLATSSSNMLYLSGFGRFLQEHDGYFLITPTQAFLITSPLYAEAVKKYTPELSLLETSPDKWYTQHILEILQKESLKTLGFEETDLKVAEYFDLLDGKIDVVPVPTRALRVIKDTKEIEALQKAVDLTDKTFTYILEKVKVGMKEEELAFEMELFMRQNGGSLAFATIIGFGENAAVPHHMTGDEKLENNNFVLFDFGAKVDNYLADMSRTIFVGTPTDKQKDIYQTTKDSQQAAIDYIEKKLAKGVSAANPLMVNRIDDLSREVIESKGYPTYPHSLGHGIGLEVHEAPTLSRYSKDHLEEGMVFTIEPGIYLPKQGGVRIEDMYVILNGKLIEMTHSTKEFIVL